MAGVPEPLEVFEVECRLCGAKPQTLCKTRAPFPRTLDPDKSHKVRFALVEARNLEREG